MMLFLISLPNFQTDYQFHPVHKQSYSSVPFDAVRRIIRHFVPDHAATRIDGAARQMMPRDRPRRDLGPPRQRGAPALLTIVGERGITAFTINDQRDERVQSSEIELAAPGERVRLLLLQEALRLRNVRKARFGFPLQYSELPIAAKL